MGTNFLQWTNEKILEEINKPVLIVAFEGWNDAGEAASTAARYLRDYFKAIQAGKIEAEEFFDFTVSRPTIELPDGQREIIWPTTNLHIAKVSKSKYDFASLIGHEPQLRWRTFTEEIVKTANKIEAEMVITLGALLTDVPHSRPVKVFGSSEDPLVSKQLDLSPSTYEGPTGIVGVLNDALKNNGIPGISLWASVPAYVSGAQSPKAALAMVQRLAEIMELKIPYTDLEIASASYEKQINEIIFEDDSTSEYVKQLEEDFDSEAAAIEDSQNPDLLVTEVEDFLRNQTGQA